VIDYARKNGVHVVCLPPHSTLKLQLLDVSFLQPLKTYYAQEIEIWLKNHPELFHTIKLLDWLGKLTRNLPQQPLLQTGSGKQACFSVAVTYLIEHDPRRISMQHHELFA
jgi:hypothetical protein